MEEEGNFQTSVNVNRFTLLTKFLVKKIACRALSALKPVGRLYPCPQWVPFIHLQRRHAPHRHERPLLANKGTLQGDFASTFVIHNGTRFFYMPQSWDMVRFFHFPSEGMHTEDFSDARKIQRVRPGLNPRTRGHGQILSLPLRRNAYGRFFRCPKNPTSSAGLEPANSGTRGHHANH